ncbi:MAG: hypothetical protein RL141_918 [Candidatus Parcubacteria bacterium]|jgi:LmbE family N-acetylglucosaminyl deacetylase
MSNPKRFLVVAAHPDDEILGVGGTVARLTHEGWEGFCVILGEGAMARDGAGREEIDRLRACAQEAGRIVGYREVVFEAFPDNQFDTVSLLSITKAVEAALARINPSVVFTHHGQDLNIDHQRTFQAVLTASRPCHANAPQELLTFETVSATEWQEPSQRFVPDTYKGIEAFLNIKQRALEAYASEMRAFPHPRSAAVIAALATVRGSECGLPAAEAFRTIRRIS